MNKRKENTKTALKLKADTHFTPQNSLLPRNTLLQNGLAHFAPQVTLLRNTLYSSAHLAP